jgi:hypothetical protein
MQHHHRPIRLATTLLLGAALTAGILTAASPANAASSGAASTAPTAVSAAPTVSDARLRFGVATPHQYEDYGTEFLIYGPRSLSPRRPHRRR